MFLNSDTPRKHWVSVPCFKTHVLIENTVFQSRVSKLRYSSKTLGFSSMFQNSCTHRKRWVSVLRFMFQNSDISETLGFNPNLWNSHIIGNTGFQCQVSKLTYSPKTLGFSSLFHVSKVIYSSEILGFSPKLQNSHIHHTLGFNPMF